MNISDAKQIPLQKLVEEFGGRYSHTDRKGDLWFFSPFRPDEKTASFKINPKLNTWHDFGLASTSIHRKQGSGGDVLDLWCDYHFKDRRSGIKEALVGLEKLGHSARRGEGFQKEQRKEIKTIQNQQPRYKILKIADWITYPGLKDELSRRRISLTLANLYLKQGHILDTETKKKYHGLLFENDKGGYEVSIPNPQRQECFKTCIGPKASTRVLSNNEEANSADVFEGFWDFLSWLEFKAIQRPHNHSYILNSTSMVNEVCEKLQAFNETVKYVFLFMDNDEAGYQATHGIAGLLEAENMQVASWEQLYRDHKDLSDFWSKGAKPG